MTTLGNTLLAKTARHMPAVLLRCAIGTVLGVSAAVAQDQDAKDSDAAAAKIELEQPAAPATRPTPLLPSLPTFTIGDGTLTLGGAVRVRYDGRFNDIDPLGRRATTNRFSYDTAAAKLSSDSSTIFGAVQYRFYGGSFLYSVQNGYDDYPGEVSFPMWAYVGYKLTPQDSITAGLNQVPFGLTPYFGSSFLETLGFAMGLEEVYDAGLKYAHVADRYNVQLGFYPTANPNGFGISRDSARYSTNIVDADSYVPDGSHNAERNMFIGRAEYVFVKADDASLAAGVSVWHSDIDNADTRESGPKQLEGVHVNATYGSWGFKAIYIRQDIWPKNPIRDDLISIGGFDSSYNLATHGHFVTAEINYKLPDPIGPFDVAPYLSYGTFIKDRAGFQTTERYILGAAWTLKADPRLLIYTEGILGRNDAYLGAGQFESGFAQGGDNRWKSEIIVNVGYYF